MAIRFAAASAFALTAALIVAAPARAQFFSFYEMSPRQVAGMLEDDGYRLRGPMIRRGDVYVCNVVSISGRPARLIVDARDGHVLERYALRDPHVDDYGDSPRALRPPRDVGDESYDDDYAPHRQQQALRDPYATPPRSDSVAGLGNSDEDSDAPPKPRRHVVKKHKEPAVAKAVPTAAPTPDATPRSESAPVAAVAPSAPSPAATPEVKKAVEAPKPESAPVAATPKAPEAKSTPPAVQAKSEPAPVAPASPEPKAEAPHKKLNDLPVNTLN